MFRPYMFSTPCVVLYVVVVVGGIIKKNGNLRTRTARERERVSSKFLSNSTRYRRMLPKEINLMAFSLLSTISIHYATFFLWILYTRFFLSQFSLFFFSTPVPVLKVNFYFVICYQNAYMTFARDHMPTLCMCTGNFSFILCSTFQASFFVVVVVIV